MRVVVVLCFFLLACFAEAAGVRQGMTRLEVETALGKPVSVMQRGNRLVLSYPKGGRVELVEDRVVDMFAVSVIADVPAEKPAAKPVDDEKVEEESVTPVAHAAGEKSETSMPTGSAGTAKMAERSRPLNEDSPATDSGVGLVLQLVVVAVIRIIIVMVVLKMAFSWADVHADWGQMFLPALADTVVRSVFAILGATVWKVTDWFYVDEAAAYFVLLFVLMKTTHACTLARAVAVAGAAKLMSIIVGGLIIVYVLHMLS